MGAHAGNSVHTKNMAILDSIVFANAEQPITPAAVFIVLLIFGRANQPFVLGCIVSERAVLRPLATGSWAWPHMLQK